MVPQGPFGRNEQKEINQKQEEIQNTKGFDDGQKLQGPETDGIDVVTKGAINHAKIHIGLFSLQDAACRDDIEGMIVRIRGRRCRNKKGTHGQHAQQKNFQPGSLEMPDELKREKGSQILLPWELFASVIGGQRMNDSGSMTGVKQGKMAACI